MSDTHIRHTRRSKHYMSPVLLDHRSLKRLGLSTVLALVIVFLSGYVVGFKKAEVKLASHIETLSIDVPVLVAATFADMEPQPPMLTEPGETIDVDSADDEREVSVRGVINVAQISPGEVIKKSPKIVVKNINPRIAHNVEQKGIEEKQIFPADTSYPLAIGGPAESDPEQEIEQLIQDTATEENAAYSVQVGMYGRLENAERIVEELIATDLSAYLTDYMNRKNEIRYNVRFGYFADRRSARGALATYEKELSGSGYIVRLQPSASAKTGG